ncbi:MAG: OFA family MFS transporter [Planctomycetes bacterium]|nr:OFA family MFS transporter [Planctomycetota bacterium]
MKKKIHYAWVILIAAMFINMASYAFKYSFGSFYPFVLMDTGWDKAVVMSAFMLHTYVACIFTIFTGALTDWIGPRWTVALLGGIFWPLSYYLTSVATSPLWFIISYGIVGAIGSSACYVPVMCTGARWFKSRRGLALGIISVGVGLGWCLTSLIVGNLILSMGWRTALLGMAIFGMVILWTSPFFLKSNPEEIGLKPYGAEDYTTTDGGEFKHVFLGAFIDVFALMAIFSKKWRKLLYISIGPVRKKSTNGREGGKGRLRRLREAELTTVDFSYKNSVRSWRFWMLFIMYFLFGMGLTAILKNAQAFVILERTLPKEIVVITFGVIIGLASIMGRLSGGFISDYLSRKITISIFSLLLALDIILWIKVPDGSISVFYVVTALLGYTYGVLAPLTPVFLADTFGRSAMAPLFGLITFGGGIGAGLGAQIPSFLNKFTDTFSTGFWIAAFVLIISIVPTWLVRPPLKEG